jgi:hypothetical protein
VTAYPVPLHLLHEWLNGEQREAGEKILADAEAQLATAPPDVAEGLTAGIRRELYRVNDLAHAQLDRVIADEIERRLRA